LGFIKTYWLRCPRQGRSGGKNGSAAAELSSLCVAMNAWPPSLEFSAARSAFIRLAKPWKKKGNRKQKKRKNKTALFLDLRTLAWALFNRSFSLKTLCEELKTEHQKLEHEPTGKVNPQEIEYARQDVRSTVDALNALKRNFDKHPISLKPNRAYSPASVAKAYLDQMGIRRPAEKFSVSNEILGISMQSYYGGRSETRLRCAEVPVVPVDFKSEYPSCCALLGLFDVLTAESVSCLLYTSPSPRDLSTSRMPSSA